MTLPQILQANFPTNKKEMSHFFRGFKQGLTLEGYKAQTKASWSFEIILALSLGFIGACIANPMLGLAYSSLYICMNRENIIAPVAAAVFMFNCCASYYYTLITFGNITQSALAIALSAIDPTRAMIDAAILSEATSAMASNASSALRHAAALVGFNIHYRFSDGLIEGKAELDKYRNDMQKERDKMAPVITVLAGTTQTESNLSKLEPPVVENVLMPLLDASARYSNQNLAKNFFGTSYAQRAIAQRAAQQEAAANRG